MGRWVEEVVGARVERFEDAGPRCWCHRGLVTALDFCRDGVCVVQYIVEFIVKEGVFLCEEEGEDDEGRAEVKSRLLMRGGLAKLAGELANLSIKYVN